MSEHWQTVNRDYAVDNMACLQIFDPFGAVTIVIFWTVALCAYRWVCVCWLYWLVAHQFFPLFSFSFLLFCFVLFCFCFVFAFFLIEESVVGETFFFFLKEESVTGEMIVHVHISMLCKDMNHLLTGLIWLRIVNTPLNLKSSWSSCIDSS